jgi:SpoVK/Ycf46/Vps4 family AAA+-type ATPase
MATAEQLKALIRSHLSDDQERFYTLALQVAAHEAQQGHGALAHDIRDIIDKERRARGSNVLLKFPQELAGMVFSERLDVPIAGLVLPAKLKERIRRVIHEHRQQEKLKSHGLSNRRKILLVGPPGTGKTMTARVLANELRLPLHTIQVDKLVTKFMGETSAKLRQIFDLIRDETGVYLFDEFDAIGGSVPWTTTWAKCVVSSTRCSSLSSRTHPIASSSRQRTSQRCWTVRSSVGSMTFCLTRHPLPKTAGDYWKMCWANSRRTR